MTILRIIHILIKVMKVTLELTNPVEMQYKYTISRIFHKILATSLPVAKILIKYNSNNLE